MCVGWGVSRLIVIRIKAEAGPPAFDRSLKAERAECDGSIDTSTPNTQAAKSGTAAALHAASSSRQRRRVLGIICVKREPKINYGRYSRGVSSDATHTTHTHHKKEKCKKTRVLMIVIDWRKAQNHIDVGSQDLNDLIYGFNLVQSIGTDPQSIAKQRGDLHFWPMRCDEIFFCCGSIKAAPHQ
jgi:hypothetical protein